MGDPDINIVIAKIKGRYPEVGWALNTRSKMMGLVLKGTGTLFTTETSVELSEGDLALIEHDEKYYWHGHMTIVIPAAPAWSVEQYRIIHDPVTE